METLGPLWHYKCMKFPQFFLCFTALLFITNTSHASSQGAIQDFELVVVESLPDDLSLDMTLTEIIEAKHRSRLALGKRRVFDRATQALELALKLRETSGPQRLIELAKAVPVKNIVDNILQPEKTSILEFTENNPFDFTIFVFPKSAKHSGGSTEPVSYGSLYPGARTSLIDSQEESTLEARSYNQKINHRLEKSVFELYQKQYLESTDNPQTFFVGAMLNIHMEGRRSSARFQVLGGLPTGLNQDLIKDQDEIFLRSINSPRVPNRQSIDSADFPGVILTVDYRPAYTERNQTDDSQLALGVAFGSLSLVGDMEWLPSDHLPRYEKPPSFLNMSWWVLKDYHKGYNVPFLLGNLVKDEVSEPAGGNEGYVRRIYAKPTGKNYLDSYLARAHKVKVNIHEVVFDLKSLEVLDVRVTLDFPRTSWWSLSLPTLALDSVGDEVKAAANDELDNNEYVQSLRKTIQKYFGPNESGGGEKSAAAKDIKKSLKKGLLDLLNGDLKGGQQ